MIFRSAEPDEAEALEAFRTFFQQPAAVAGAAYLRASWFYRPDVLNRSEFT
jgi:hypothetical protein